MITKYTPLEYLKIDIANNYSSKLEKSNFDVRINWFNENQDNLTEFVKEADNPALYLAGINAYSDYLNKIPSGYLVSFDASASGIQLLAALVGCRKSAKVCGLISTDRQDAYTNLYKLIDPNQTYTREQVKNTIMTAYYNSTEQPKKLFKSKELLAKFYEILLQETPGAFNLNTAIKQLWNNNTLCHNFVAPDNFHAVIPVIDKANFSFNFLGKQHQIIKKVNQKSDNFRSLSPNIIHFCDAFVVREMQNRCNYKPNQLLYITDCFGHTGTRSDRDKDVLVIKLVNHFKETGILSARILNYIDKENIGHIDREALARLINLMPLKPFELLTIHDAFRSLVNYAHDVRVQYNTIMSEIASSNLLQYIARTITGNNKITIGKYEDISDDILNSEYALS